MKVETLTIDDDFLSEESDSSQSNQAANTQSNQPPDDKVDETTFSRLPSSNNEQLNDELNYQSLETHDEDEPLELDINPNNHPGNNVFLRILIVVLATGVVALIIALLFKLFNVSTGDFNANQSSDGTETQDSLDPLAQAQRESEQKTAQLILLGDEPVVNSPKQPPPENSTPTPTPTPTPNQPTNPNPPPSTVRQVSRRTTPSTPSSSRPPSTVRRVSSPSTPNQPPNSATTSQSQPKELPSRETLAKRGWSGFAPSEQQQDQQQLANSNPVIPNSNVSNSANNTNQPLSIPVIRISLSDNSQTIPNPSDWSYYAQKKTPFLVTLNSQTNDTDPSVKRLPSNSPSNPLPTYKSQRPVPSTSSSTPQLTPQSSPTVFPVGTQLKARLETPIIWTDEMKDNPRPFTLTLTENLLAPSGKIVLPIGTSFSGKVTNVTTNGMVIAEIITFSYQNNRQWKTIQIPSNTMLVLGNNTQPLMAKVLNDPGGNIATQDALLGVLGAAEAGLNHVNTADTQTEINTNGFGFNSTTTTNQQGNLVTGLAEGLFSTLKGRLEQRAETAIDDYGNQQPIYVVNNGTDVTILINAILEIN